MPRRGKRSNLMTRWLDRLCVETGTIGNSYVVRVPLWVVERLRREGCKESYGDAVLPCGKSARALMSSTSNRVEFPGAIGSQHDHDIPARLLSLRPKNA